MVFPRGTTRERVDRRAWEAVRSRGDHIRLVWVELAAVVDLPILPMSAKAFLIAARLAGDSVGLGHGIAQSLAPSSLPLTFVG